jgi:hypothetical protein
MTLSPGGRNARGSNPHDAMTDIETFRIDVYDAVLDDQSDRYASAAI